MYTHRPATFLECSVCPLRQDNTNKGFDDGRIRQLRLSVVCKISVNINARYIRLKGVTNVSLAGLAVRRSPSLIGNRRLVYVTWARVGHLMSVLTTFSPRVVG